MDYGQNGQFEGSSQSFFTAGVGDANPNTNTFEPENDLNQGNFIGQTEPTSPQEEPIYSENHNYRNFGSQAISSHENFTEESVSSPEDNPNNLGEIIDLTPPPTTSAPTTNEVVPFNPNHIRTSGDHLDKTALNEMSQAIDRLSQTGNAADFYATIRGSEEIPGMMRENLKNSYDRKVA